MQAVRLDGVVGAHGARLATVAADSRWQPGNANSERFMPTPRNWPLIGLIGVLVVVLANPAAAQGNSKKTFDVSFDVAIEATKATLVQEGFDVVKLEPKDEYLIVHYRRGNMGKGKAPWVKFMRPPCRGRCRRAWGIFCRCKAALGEAPTFPVFAANEWVGLGCVRGA